MTVYPTNIILQIAGGYFSHDISLVLKIVRCMDQHYIELPFFLSKMQRDQLFYLPQTAAQEGFCIKTSATFIKQHLKILILTAIGIGLSPELVHFYFSLSQVCLENISKLNPHVVNALLSQKDWKETVLNMVEQVNKGTGRNAKLVLCHATSQVIEYTRQSVKLHIEGVFFHICERV